MFFLQLRHRLDDGYREELVALLDLLDASGVRPHIDRVLPLGVAGEGLAAMAAGELLGNLVLRP